METLLAGVGLLLMLVALSVWHQYQLYKQTRQLQESVLHHAKRAETADAFGYVVAHDLRVPLLQILNRTKLLAHALSDKPTTKVQLQEIEQIASLADQMVKKMLQLHRLEEEELLVSEFDMGQLVKSTYEEAKETTNYAGSIDIDCLPSVNADRVLMHQVWQNLLTNGMKFSAEVPKSHVKVSDESATDSHISWLADNGKGLPVDALIGIMEPFEHLRRVKGEGYGLGLAIVKRIVQKHGGQVWAENLPQGARFGFSLPSTLPQENKSFRSI